LIKGEITASTGALGQYKKCTKIIAKTYAIAA